MFGSVASLALVALLPSAMAEWAKYQIQPNANHGLCIAPKSADNGSTLVLKSCDSADTVFKYSSNSGKLKSVAHNICADVKDGLQGDGTPAQVWDCFQCNRNQMFDFVPFDGVGFYHIKWNRSPYCLDLKDGNVAEGAEIQLWNCIDYNDNQKWIVNPIDDEECLEGEPIEGDSSAETYAAAAADAEQEQRRMFGKRRL